MIYLYVHVCFVLPWSVESFLFMLWRWRNKLKWAPFEFFALSPLLRVRAIVNNKQCEMRGLFMSLVIRYWIADVQDSQGVSASKMTYTVSGEALNSLTHWQCLVPTGINVGIEVVCLYRRCFCSLVRCHCNMTTSYLQTQHKRISRVSD